MLLAAAAPSDEDLLTAWREGDLRAGEQLFDRHFAALFRFFGTKAAEAAQDLTQDTLAACVKGRNAIVEAGKFRAYMFSVARRLLRDHYESQRREHSVDMGTLSVVDMSPGANSLILDREEQRLLLEALRRLPVDYQIAVELHTFEEMTGPEIAEVLEVPEGTIRSRIRRARLQLRTLIRELASSPDILASTLTGLDEWALQVRQQLGPDALKESGR